MVKLGSDRFAVRDLLSEHYVVMAESQRQLTSVDVRRLYPDACFTWPGGTTTSHRRRSRCSEPSKYQQHLAHRIASRGLDATLLTRFDTEIRRLLAHPAL